MHKIEERILFKIKSGYQLLTPEKMKFAVSTESKIIKKENGEHVPRLEITEVVLIHCNITNKIYWQNSRAS